jgi:serine/threonine protein kinase
MIDWQNTFDIVSDFAESFMAGDRPRIEDFLGTVQHWNETERTKLALQLVETEIDLREHRGEQVTDREREAYGERFPLLRTQNRYLLQRELGRGGYGVVYRAWDRQTNQQIALKKLQDVTHHDDRSKARFAAERQAVSSLVHPHIVQFLDAGREANGRDFICYELIEGKTLKELVQPLPPEQVAANWTRDIARAIDHAHHHGVIHRDLKPGNIMLDQVRGRVKVLDFGVAKLNPEHFTEAVFGPTGSAPPPGTWLWMAPEQHRGLADERSDIHGIGSILYFLLTGQPPLDSTWRQPPGQPLPTPTLLRDRDPNISRQLERICFHALSFHPDERYQTAGELADDLDRFLAGKTVLAPKVRKLWSQLSSRTRPTAKFFLGITGLLALFLGIFYGTAPEKLGPASIAIPTEYPLKALHWPSDANDLEVTLGNPNSHLWFRRITEVQTQYPVFLDFQVYKYSAANLLQPVRSFDGRQDTERGHQPRVTNANTMTISLEMCESESVDPEVKKEHWYAGFYLGGQLKDDDPGIIQTHAILISNSMNSPDSQIRLRWLLSSCDITDLRDLSTAAVDNDEIIIQDIELPGSIYEWHRFEITINSGSPEELKHNGLIVKQFRDQRAIFSKYPKIYCTDRSGIYTMGSKWRYRNMRIRLPIPPH